MDDVSRYVSITYLCGGLLLAWFYVRIIDLVFESTTPSADTLLLPGVHLSMAIGAVLAIGTTIYLYKSEKTHTWLTQVVDELIKVTWPKWLETRENTVVVIIFAVLVSICLALFDMFFRWLTGLIL